MAIEHLEERVELPYDREAILEGGKSLADYLYKLVEVLKDVGFANVHTVLNAVVDVTNTDWQYWGARDPVTGVYPDGSWRVGIVDGGLERQKKVDGAWTTVGSDNI